MKSAQIGMHNLVITKQVTYSISRSQWTDDNGSYTDKIGIHSWD